MTTPERSPAPVAARGPRKLAPLAVACVLSVVVARCVMVPWAEVVVPWPERAVGVRIQVWGFLAPYYYVVVESPKGRVSRLMWMDWGPADQANLCLTPRGSLAAIGGGALAAMVDVPADAPPREARPFDISDAEEWRYLGHTVWSDGALRFHAASEHRECIPLYGEGDVPVRKRYQARGSYC